MSEASTAVVRTQNLAKTYVLGFFRKKVQAVRDVTLEVERGEIFGLLGPNGAGKTTTLKVLLGLIRPSAGRAELLGRPLGDLEAKRRLGYLPETPYFYDYLTGRELLIFVGELFDLPRRVNARRADALLDRLGLARAAGLALRRYSKGMLQRLGVAQALINDPDLVLLDEPLSGLDPLGRKQLRELIAGLREQGKTVVLSSHILADVELLADRVAILVEGRSVDTGPLDALLDPHTLSTEVVFSRPGEALQGALAAAGHRPEILGDRGRITLAGDAPADPLLALIAEHGGSVLAVSPRKESLEDLVVREVQRQRGGGDDAEAPSAPGAQRGGQ
jgi:ABC-2 type transport system ATP-binding protein